jgi:2,4-dienoyl-CoA reductase-like NADH-dependent reductase (Old Yellow Enzyme family)
VRRIVLVEGTPSQMRSAVHMEASHNEEPPPTSPAATVQRNGTSFDDVLAPASLPCGLVLRNRLVKAATYEHLAPLLGGPPTRAHCALYARWAAGGWGMVVTGNVQVAPEHLTLGRDLVLPRALDAPGLAPFRALARAARGVGTLAIMQLSHAGRQSPVLLGGRRPFARAVAPSAIPLRGRGGWFARVVYTVMFPAPRALTPVEIDGVISRFVLGARVAHAAGFDGIELHAAHGCAYFLPSLTRAFTLTLFFVDLLAQFLSPKSNTRTDMYSVDNALALICRIVHEIRKELPTAFALGVKISSADIVEAGATACADDVEAEARALGYVREIARWGTVDFIEISGGDYENPGASTLGRVGRPGTHRAMLC